MHLRKSDDNFQKSPAHPTWAKKTAREGERERKEKVREKQNSLK